MMIQSLMDYIYTDAYENIAVEGNYFTVYASPIFEDDYMTWDSYTVAVNKSSGARDFIYRFHNINDAFESVEDLNKIFTALQSYDGITILM